MRKSVHDWRAFVDEAGGPSIDTLKKPIYEAPDPDLIANVERCFLFSFLLGMDHASNPLDMADGTWDPIPFEEAVSFMKARVPLTKSEWNPLEEKLRFRAFTVAALSEPDAIERIRGQLLNTLESGAGVKELWDTAKLEDMAGIGQNPHYWENVYRTNIQTAYNAGRAAEFMRNQPEYITLVGVEDLRQTDICYSLTHNPVILPATHPFWKTHWPPFHFRCRTTVRGMYPEEVEAMREDGSFVRIDEKALKKTVKPAKGFGGNPIDSGSYWMMRESQILRGIKHGIITEFNRSDNVIFPEDYKKLWKGYSRTKGKNGGWYDLCETPPNDWDKNKPVVEFLAERGYQIKVIPAFQEVQGWKNPDVYIDGVLADIKEPESWTVTAIKNQLQKAQKQKVSTVILNLGNIHSAVVKRGLKGRMNTPGNKVTRVYVVYNNKVFDLNEDMIKADNFGF